VDAQPELALIARAMARHGLEALLIGNMGAALHGAPVSTVDIDFFFRRTPRNVQRLKAVAQELGATILRPYYPVSALFRLQREQDGLQIDFMGQIDGFTSWESVRSRADSVSIGGQAVLVAALGDIIHSKRAAGREKDGAVISILERTLLEEASLSRQAANPIKEDDGERGVTPRKRPRTR